MDELDHLLSRLRDAPLDPRLGGLESRVMAEIARIQAIPRLGATTFGIAAATALFIGIAGSAVRRSLPIRTRYRPSMPGSRLRPRRY